VGCPVEFKAEMKRQRGSVTDGTAWKLAYPHPTAPKLHPLLQFSLPYGPPNAEEKSEARRESV
jgi:hypothetical protein